MSAPSLTASKWDSKKMGWVVPRPIYKVWWLGPGMGVIEKYVVADRRPMAIRKAQRKWGKGIRLSVGASLLVPKGLKRPPYASPLVHLK